MMCGKNVNSTYLTKRQALVDRNCGSEVHLAATTWIGMLLLFGWISPVSVTLETPDGWTPATAKLVVSDRLATEDKEIVVETDEWKVNPAEIVHPVLIRKTLDNYAFQFIDQFVITSTSA
jgi:hypothetical protein